MSMPAMTLSKDKQVQVFVARNHAGTGWSRDSLCGSAEEAECIAALSGIRKAHQSSSGPILLESDCLNVVQAITEISLNRSANCYIIEELREH